MRARSASAGCAVRYAHARSAHTRASNRSTGGETETTEVVDPPHRGAPDGMSPQIETYRHPSELVIDHPGNPDPV